MKQLKTILKNYNIENLRKNIFDKNTYSFNLFGTILSIDIKELELEGYKINIINALAENHFKIVVTRIKNK